VLERRLSEIVLKSF